MDFLILLPVKIICRALVFSAPIISIGVFIASVAADAPRSVALNVISGITAVCLSLAYMLLFKTEITAKNAPPPSSRSEMTYEKLFRTLQEIMRPSATNIALLHAAAIVLLIVLAVRLDATDQFGGYPANLDFGLKGYGDGENVAFTRSSSTVGHFVQGVLASFLSYPAVAGLLARVFGSRDGTSKFLFRQPRMSLLLFCELLSACMTIYPAYSLIKRFNKDSVDFARTSHMNNTTEWVLGYVVGVGLGWLVTIWVQRSLLTLAGLFSPRENGTPDNNIMRVVSALTVSESEVDGDAKYGFGMSSEYNEKNPTKGYRAVSVLCSTLLLLLSITSFLTGVFIGLTWNYQQEELVQKVNKEITASFALLWVIVTFFMTWFASKKWPFNFHP